MTDIGVVVADVQVTVFELDILHARDAGETQVVTFYHWLEVPEQP